MDFHDLLQEDQKSDSLPQVLQATRELHSQTEVTQTESQDIQAYVSSIYAINDFFFQILSIQCVFYSCLEIWILNQKMINQCHCGLNWMRNTLKPLI